MDLGDWSIRNWRALAGLTSAVLVVSGGLAGAITDYRGYFPALGGPNGLLYDLTLKVAQPWRRNIPTVPAVFVAIDDASLSTPELAALPRALFQPVGASPERWAAGGQGASDRFRCGVCLCGCRFPSRLLCSAGLRPEPCRQSRPGPRSHRPRAISQRSAGASFPEGSRWVTRRSSRPSA